MDANAYQLSANRFANYPVPVLGDTELKWDYPAHGLSEEAGEVEGKFAKAIRDCNGVIDESRREEIVKELGDVCWFVAELATILNVSLSDVMQKNLDKLSSRYERGVIGGSGDNR